MAQPRVVNGKSVRSVARSMKMSHSLLLNRLDPYARYPADNTRQDQACALSVLI